MRLHGYQAALAAPSAPVLENTAPPASFSPANTIFVETNGSDTTGDGSRDKPFATLQKAVDTAGTGGTKLIKVGKGIFSGFTSVTGYYRITGASWSDTFIGDINGASGADGADAYVEFDINAADLSRSGLTPDDARIISSEFSIDGQPLFIGFPVVADSSGNISDAAFKAAYFAAGNPATIRVNGFSSGSLNLIDNVSGIYGVVTPSSTSNSTAGQAGSTINALLSGMTISAITGGIGGMGGLENGVYNDSGAAGSVNLNTKDVVIQNSVNSGGSDNGIAGSVTIISDGTTTIFGGVDCSNGRTQGTATLFGVRCGGMVSADTILVRDCSFSSSAGFVSASYFETLADGTAVNTPTLGILANTPLSISTCKFGQIL